MFTNKKDTSGIFSVIKNNTYHNHLVLFCIYGCTSFVEITKGKEDILNGTLSLDIAYEHIPGFKEYYLNLRPNEDSDAEFKKVWESFFNCSLPGTGTARKPCTGKIYDFNQYIFHVNKNVTKTQVSADSDSLIKLINN